MKREEVVDLEQFRKQAKDLRKAHGEGRPEAARRLKAHVRRFAGLVEKEVLAADLALRDAQHAIAREHGYNGWQELRQAVVAALSAPPPRSLVVDAVEYGGEPLVPVQILRVDFQDRGDAGKVAHVVLRDAGDRLLPITIGDPEGLLLKLALEGRRFPRPLSHDLLTACLDQLGGRVHSVVIHAIRDEVFYAHVHLEAVGKPIAMDARPSDGLIQAVRHQAPVFATEPVMEKAGLALADLDRLLDRLSKVDVRAA